MRVGELLESLLGLVFPEACAGCGRQGALLCEACRASLRPFPGGAAGCGAIEVRVAFVYEGALREAVHALKYRRARRAARPLGRLLAAEVAAGIPPVDAVVPVPLHPRRRAERGYNQAEEIGRELAAALRSPVLGAGLTRARATERQAGLDAHQRAGNVAGAFRWAGPGRAPARAVLVDDVVTSGATMAACAAALWDAGAEEVYGVALARSRPDLDRMREGEKAGRGA